MKTEIPVPAQPRKRKRVAVCRVTLFRRADSRFWQACVRMNGLCFRRSTNTQSLSAAKTYAELLQKHFSNSAAQQLSSSAAQQQLPLI